MKKCKHVRLSDGRKVWRSRLRLNYDDNFEQFMEYAETYGLLEKLEFSTAQEAWNKNPMIQGSCDPKDFMTVQKYKQLVKELASS